MDNFQAYGEFARVYDMFQDNVDYQTWGKWLKQQLAAQGITDGLVLDLGCGTGSMTELLAEKDSFELFTWMVMVLNEKDKRKQLLAKGIHGYMEVIAAYMIGIFMSPLLLEIMILAAKILGWIVCKIWV